MSLLSVTKRAQGTKEILRLVNNRQPYLQSILIGMACFTH
jgi:hypothetical protein